MSIPIHILQVVTHMNRGGLETMLMNYYRHIDRNKIQFDFLVHRSERGDYDNEIESLGGKIYRMPRLIPWGRTYHNALHNFFEEHPEFLIIHVHQDCLSSVILSIAKQHNVPVRIAHSHSSSQDKDIKYPIKLLYKRSITKYATKLFACSQSAGDWMFGKAKYDIMNNAIDVAKYRYNADIRKRIRKELSIPENTFVVGHVGRFSYPKNHIFLLDIFKNVLKNKHVMLLLVGDGLLRTEIEKKIHELKLEKHVILTGVRADVADLLQAMDVFVFPSIYEGAPVTMFEAQAAGLPCIISDKVPSDCVVTDLVQTISLSSAPEEWADKIISIRNIIRIEYYKEVAHAGYDIVENAKWLEQFYCSQQKENE